MHLAMNTFTQIIYQIVFSTKHREKTLDEAGHQQLYNFFWGVLKKHHCHLYRVGGVQDHVHLITSLHPSVSLATLVKDLKGGSSVYIRAESLFVNFNGWQNGYAAFTYSVEAKDALVAYVKNQADHHRETTYQEELIALLHEQRVTFDEKYLD